MTRVKSIFDRTKMKNVRNFGLAITAGLILTGAYSYHHNMVESIGAKEKAIESLQREAEQKETELQSRDQEAAELLNENEQLREKVRRLQIEVSRQMERTFDVEVTAYDLSAASCGKNASDPGYGVTATGMSLAGHSRESARVIAVDPRKIPLGSKVRLRFEDPAMKTYDGIYIAADTGGAINNNRIDLFVGEGSHAEAMAFGRRAAKATIL